jgi:anthranilate synthase component 2
MPLADHPHRRTDAPRPATLRWGSLPVPSHHSAQPCWRRRCSSAPLLMIDNYDSFTYNLVQYFGELGPGRHEVFRNDAITWPRSPLNPDRSGDFARPLLAGRGRHLGGGDPHFAGKLPLLGVCLGHQSIGAAFGGKIVHAKKLMHGKVSPSPQDARACSSRAAQSASPARATTRWPSSATLPDCLEVTAWTDDGEIMGVRHKTLAVEGRAVPPRIHPDRARPRLLKNFLEERAKCPFRSDPARSPAAHHRAPRNLPRRDAAPDAPDHERRDLAGDDGRAIITGLRVKKETIGEITAAAQVMREFATKVQCRPHAPGRHRRHRRRRLAHLQHLHLRHVRGRRGRRQGQPSTAGAACRKSGSADVLEALGANINLQPSRSPSALPRPASASCSRPTTTRR